MFSGTILLLFVIYFHNENGYFEQLNKREMMVENVQNSSKEN